MSTRAQRQKAKNALVEKFWGNATMTDHSALKTATFTQYQCARRAAWVHGMYEGFKAGLRLGRTQCTTDGAKKRGKKR
jgi:hypothetical protein